MRAVLPTTVLACVLATLAVAAPADAVGPRQVAKAVAAAERSTSLWATINICSSRSEPDDLGVRGQMPTLGFPATLTMVVQVNYWSAPRKRFVAIKSVAASRTLKLGRLTAGLQQDGAVFPFRPHTGLLNASITFTWTRDGKVVGQVQRRTTAGHPTADFGSPPRYSAAQCLIH
ncbi:MAG TPA: hypothetical protein VHX62_17065 [Solirubrobacteraceae bacterium]|jgi:hypothetical protein|nr:hypothetical protein [Solirubrobacteraceae bacterium]